VNSPFRAFSARGRRGCVLLRAPVCGRLTRLGRLQVNGGCYRSEPLVRRWQTSAATGGARPCSGLSVFALAVDRRKLPTSSYLLGLCRRSTCAVRALGRRLDDCCAAMPLSSSRHLWSRFGTQYRPARGALVPAVAIWPLVHRQRARSLTIFDTRRANIRGSTAC